MTVTLR